MKRRISMAILLSLGISATSYGHVTAPILPLDQSYFTKIEIKRESQKIETPKPKISDFREKKEAVALNQPILVDLKPKSEIKRPKISQETILGTRKVGGVATWYCKAGVSSCHYKYPDVSGAQMYAAAGSEIRIGKWRNRIVQVCGNGKCIKVKLVDWCGCGGSRIIDLYSDAFRQLISLGRGTVKVTVSW